MTLEKRSDRRRLKGGTLPWPSLRRLVDFPSAEAIISSPGLERFMQHLSGAERPPILDLGSPSASNIDFLSQYQCVLHISDLFRALDEDPGMSTPEEERDIEAVMGRVVSFEDDVRFDGILSWNLFDYLDAPVVRAFADRITPHCHSGTILLMMTSNGETIPENPGRVTIVDRCHLRFERLGAGTRVGAKYTPLGLERLMPGFRLQHSFLLQQGMQDYLFVRN